MEESKEGDALVWAIERMKQLEHVVATLTEKIKVVEKENFVLKQLVATSQDSSKVVIPLSEPSLTEEISGKMIKGSEETVASQESWLENESCTASSQVEHVSRNGKKDGLADRRCPNLVTRHVALRIMYFGSSYHGFASQGGSQKTVESALFAALEHTKLLIGDRAKVNYSRCGRTDKGVSAFGQLVALQVRSKLKTPVQGGVSKMLLDGEKGGVDTPKYNHAEMDIKGSNVDRVAAARASRKLEKSVSANIGVEDEIDYVGVLNRVLPDDIRVLGWCPVPQDFSARFSCLYREYNYYFSSANLNINAMKLASASFLGDHDFRNFCKMDAANVHNFRRTISMFEIRPVYESWAGQQVWVMCIRGTAFLWHQIRCMVAVLFMVGQGYESLTIVEELLDVEKVKRKPQYIMASEFPLVLHTCSFEGLTLHCQPRAAMHLQGHLSNILEKTLLKLALLQEALSELPSASVPAEKCSTLKEQHVPLLLRQTEPSYEERRRSSLSAS